MTPKNEPTTSNQRVTNAVLAVKMDTLATDIGDVKEMLSAYGIRIRAIETTQARTGAKLERVCKDVIDVKGEVKEVKVRNYIWNVTNSVLAAIAGILGISIRQ
jgi:hypothetical protein